MKLDRGLLVGVAMVVVAITSAGCKSSGDPSAAPDPGQPGVQAPSDTATPANGPEDPSARRHRGHHGRGRGNGEWQRKRRAQAGDQGGDPAQPQVPPQQ